MTEFLTPTEIRQRLAVVRDKAIAAGLTDVVRRTDASLMIAAHAEIVQQLDTPDPEPPAAIPPPRRPGIAPPPASAQIKPAGRPQRKPTVPDAYDLEIPV